MKKALLVCMVLFGIIACNVQDDGYVEPIEQVSQGTILGTEEQPLGIGGPNQQNAVYVDLSTETAVAAPRDAWDLGFYCGEGNRIVLNGSLGMAVKKLATTDITLTQQTDSNVSVGTFNPINMAYVDNPSGTLDDTAFGAVATTEATASVYLVNQGFTVPTAIPTAGSVNVAGPLRGWKKVKIWATETGYTVQYADLNATTVQTVTVVKDPQYNFVFLNLFTGQTVAAEPPAADWDLHFSTFTNEVFEGTVSAGAYFYSDYIVTNTKAGVTAVAVSGDSAAYNAFNLAAFNSGDYELSTDQRAIGEHWRDVFTRTTFDDIFFVVRDADGILYKIRFIAMLNSAGERGFPSFQYALLQ